MTSYEPQEPTSTGAPLAAVGQTPGVVTPEQTRLWAAWIRLVATAVGLLVALTVVPQHVVLWGALAFYVLLSAGAVVWVRRGSWPTVHLTVFLLLDLVAVSLGVYALGVNTIIATFYFPLVAGYVMSFGPRVGRMTMLLSLVAYVILVLLERYGGVPLTPLAPSTRPPAGPAHLGLMPIPLFVMTSLGVYFFLHYSIRRIERQNEILRQNLADAHAAEAQQRELRSRLAEVQRLESLGRLAGGVAHDFNNMLTAIQGYAELLQDAVKTNPEATEDVAEVLRATEQAAELTQQLLAFSRKQVIRPRVVDLNRLVQGLERMLVRIIGEDVAFGVTVSTEGCRVLANRPQLEQLIVNLVVNARDALHENGAIEVEVKPVDVAESAAETFDLPAGGEHVLLTVRDSGEGMSETTLERIFEPFFTTKEKGRGTGLGLATVYGVVKQHRGGIRVSSIPGSGTTFRVYLPRTREATGTMPDAAPAEGGGAETLLVVEDELTLRRLAERVLSRAGYLVHVAADGDAALALLKEHQPAINLLVTDVLMPGMTGRQLAEAVTRQLPELRVLYISGYDGGALSNQSSVLPQDVNLLQKPFREEHLLEAVRAVLDRGRWRQDDDDGVEAE